MTWRVIGWNWGNCEDCTSQFGKLPLIELFICWLQWHWFSNTLNSVSLKSNMIWFYFNVIWYIPKGNLFVLHHCAKISFYISRQSLNLPHYRESSVCFVILRNCGIRVTSRNFKHKTFLNCSYCDFATITKHYIVRSRINFLWNIVQHNWFGNLGRELFNLNNCVNSTLNYYNNNEVWVTM